MRAAEKFPVYDSGPYPEDVQTDHEIWRSLPKEIRDATTQVILALEKQFVPSKNSSSEEREFNKEIRTALVLAVGVLQEAAAGNAPLATSNRTGNA